MQFLFPTLATQPVSTNLLAYAAATSKPVGTRADFSIPSGGINLAKMSAKAQLFANAGYRGTLRFQHGVATLNLRLHPRKYPAAAPPPIVIDE